jgi:RNA polymerase sigma-70 factor, ECF subfamily
VVKKLLLMASDTLPVNNDGASASAVLNEADFENLFQKNYASLCAYCEIKYGLSAETSRDIVQSSFLKLWEARHSLEAIAAARAYLFKIATNSSLDLIKHHQMRSKKEQHLMKAGNPPLLADGYQHIDFKELQVAVDAAIAEFPDQMRRIFIMCKIDGMTYSAAAEVLNISVKTIETQMGRALSRMRQKLLRFLICLFLFMQLLF